MPDFFIAAIAVLAASVVAVSGLFVVDIIGRICKFLKKQGVIAFKFLFRR